MNTNGKFKKQLIGKNEGQAWIIYSYDFDEYLCIVREGGFYHCVASTQSESQALDALLKAEGVA